jgi:hypothetical protein
MTRIPYELPFDGEVLIEVYNSIGQRVATLVNGIMKQGSHEAVLDGSGLASGAYFYRLSIEPMTRQVDVQRIGQLSMTDVKRLVLLK